MDKLQVLKHYSTAEVADALDSLYLEGGLLSIKPLMPGIKIAGPAFTVKYLPYEEKPQEFKSNL